MSLTPEEEFKAWQAKYPEEERTGKRIAPWDIEFVKRAINSGNPHWLSVECPAVLAKEIELLRAERDQARASLEALARLRSHPGFATLLSAVEDSGQRCARLAMEGGNGVYTADEFAQRADAYHSLLSLLRPAPASGGEGSHG